MAENLDWAMLCGLYKSQTNDGRKYLSGNLGMAKVMVWPNKNKQGERSPDFWVYVVPGRPKGMGKFKEERNDEQKQQPADDYQF